MWIRTTAGWSPVRSGYIRVNTSGTGWKRFWFKANLPNEITKPRFNTTNTSGTGTIYDGPTATSPQYLNENLFGKDGTYSNYTAISDRKISYGDTDTADINSRTVIVYDDRFTSAGGVTTANRISVDDKYLFYEMTVSNGTDPLNSINSISNGIKMIKSQPQLGPFTTALTGNSTPLSTLTFNYNLENFYYNRVEQANSKIRWWRSSTQSASGTLLKEETISATLTSSDSSSLSGQSTYTVAASADNDYYIVVEIIAGSSWTRHFGYSNAYQIDSFSSAKIQPPYRFSFGKTIYVGTNGYIGLDSGSYSPSNLPDGRSIAIFVKDLTQYYLAEYSDSSVYYLYIKSYLYNTSASSVNALDYQIKFYNDPNINYCDIYIVRKGSNVGSFSNISTGYYGAWGQTDPKYAGMVGPYSISQGTVFRVYFGDQAGTTSGIPWTAVNNNLWDTVQEWSYPPGLDDDWTAVVSAANQSAPFPTNTVAPTLTTDTGNFSAGSTITLNTGTWTGTNSYTYEILYGGSTPIATDSTATKTLINTNQYVITNADASAPSYYFRGRVTGYSGSGQTGNSAIALSATSARSTITPSTTISVGTATSSGFTISGTASPAAYTTLTEIQIWNSAQTSQAATITTGLPTINTTTGAWSYTWTGGSSSTTYYAKAKVRSSDSDQTTITTGFSNSITTSAGVSTPTSLTAENNSGAIRLTFSGGTGDQYDIYYSNGSTRPTDGQAFADYPNVTSPYDPPLTSRDIERWFWVRKSTGSLRSNWYPSDSSVSIRLPLLAPPTPVITNSAQSSTSLSWHWTQPTPSASQDEPTSWDYNISTSTATPSSWTNITTRPTAASPLVTSSLSASTTYYLHVRAKNKDASTTTYQSGTTSAASVSPGAPTGLSVSRSVGSNFLSTSLSPSASGFSTKTQTWSFGRNTTFTINFTRGSNATGSEMYYNTTGLTPASTVDQNGGTSASASGSFSYVGAASTTNDNDYAVYFWVRSYTSTEKSAWTYAGTENVDTPLYSGFEIRLYRTSTTSGIFTTATPSRNALTYDWTGVATGFSHQAQVRLTFDGTQLIRSS